MSNPANRAVLSLFGALVLAGCHSGDGHRPGDAGPPGDSAQTSDEVLPAGTILRYRVGGGIVGYADRLDISDDRVARLYIADKLASEAPLTTKEAKELDSLRARSVRINVEHNPPPETRDGAGSSIVFDGKGSELLEREVDDFLFDLHKRLRALVRH